ncbi:MAG TPA: ferric reductase-like transmembrane domain-containing protein [Saprospiraceae bacterium]|nr:ferric reductase-like transmembrane domain-containing protein [Saprospiraceae bacterium]HMQ82961.1 ferric reductase-like transmembrane domain-containing protein [Saprospiraceae bacterium]
MSISYTTVQWNRQKRRYDRIMLAIMGGYLLTFAAAQFIFYPNLTPETTIIRATGTLAYFMLQVILCIGPLSRLDSRFMPLLYNRRHLGVTMFLVALVHGLFNIVQFHALGNTDPLLSLFISNTNYGSVMLFPFQVLGFFALLILFLMAATSHDFWLKNLGPRTWKSLHMMVYVAYALLVFHVMLGVIELEQSPFWIGLTGVGVMTVVGLHVTAAALEQKRLMSQRAFDLVQEGYFDIGPIEAIAENRAKIVFLEGENIAIFKYENKISAVSNICRHQHGPLGEGAIVDGCITCPWHGYQYYPHNGQSPPPFTEKLETYDVKIADGNVWVHPKPYPEGTERPAALVA